MTEAFEPDLKGSAGFRRGSAAGGLVEGYSNPENKSSPGADIQNVLGQPDRANLLPMNRNKYFRTG